MLLRQGTPIRSALLFFVLFTLSPSWANESQSSENQIESNFKIDLALLLQTNSVFRGAETWIYPSFFIGPSFTLWQKLSIRGPMLEWQFFDRMDSWLLNIGTRYIGSGAPLIKFADKSYRNNRKKIWDVYLRFAYKFAFRKLFSVGFEVAPNMIQSKGLYSEFFIKVPVLPFVSLGAAVGYSDAAMARNLYGVDAQKGWSQLSLTLTHVLIQKLPYDSSLITVLKWSTLLQEKNKQADLIRSNSQNVSLSLILSTPIL